METDAIVQTGFDELDEKFQHGGFPKGNMCIMESDPKSPLLPILLQIYQNTAPESTIITPFIPELKVEQSLQKLGMNPDLIDSVTGFDSVENLQSVLDLVQNASTEGSEIILLNSIEYIKQEMDVREFFAQLNQIIVDENVLVIITTINQQNTDRETSITTIGGYIADIILTLTHTMSKDDISQEIYINRMPAGVGVKETYEEKRIMEITDTRGRVEISTGGFI